MQQSLILNVFVVTVERNENKLVYYVCPFVVAGWRLRGQEEERQKHTGPGVLSMKKNKKTKRQYQLSFSLSRKEVQKNTKALENTAKPRYSWGLGNTTAH